jgi:hypothetical protein
MNLDHSHLQAVGGARASILSTVCWIGLRAKMAKRRIPDVCEEVDTWTKKQGETTDGSAGKNEASSGRRVRTRSCSSKARIVPWGYGP